MATLSANGKRLGRPPNTPTAKQPVLDPSTLAVAKVMQTYRARYDAAGRGRRVAGWNPPSSGPNTAIEGLQTIRDRSRDVGRNDWSGESSTQKWSTSLIGIGITPRFNRIKSKTRKQFLTDLWNDVVATIDAEGVNNAYGQQTLVVRSWMEAGEVFARRRARALEDDLPLPFQVQLLEAEMVPLLDADTYIGLPVGNRIRSGIELNKRGKRVAYWVYKEHPGDNKSLAVNANDLVRVAASDMIHVFEQKRPGQLRGVSALAPVITRLRNIGDYEDTTLERQKIANLWVGFITRSLPTMDPNDVNTGALTGLEQSVAPDGSGLTPLKPGLIQELEDGQEFTFANPPEAGTTYSDYMRTSHLGTAAASGMPYELFSGDIKEISDRTLRVLVNEFRRFAEQRQWQIIIPQYCQRIIGWFVDAAVLAGKITLDEVDDVRRVEHAPHGWAYIHPVQDVTGKALEVSSGFRSRSSVVGERGDDIDMVDEERATDMKREADLGLPATGGPKLPTAPAQGSETPPPPAPPTAADIATIKRLEAETDMLRARTKQLGAPAATTEPTEHERQQLALTARILASLEEGNEQ